MGFLDITRGREADDQPTDNDAEFEGETADATDDEGDETGRRLWPVVLGLVAIAVVGYLVARQRAAREAEFTEIELEPTASESEESASTE